MVLVYDLHIRQGFIKTFPPFVYASDHGRTNSNKDTGWLRIKVRRSLTIIKVRE